MKASLVIAAGLALCPSTLQAAGDASGVAVTALPVLGAVTRVISGASAQDAFRHPSGLFIDRQRGIFLVADRGNHRLILFDETGRCRGTIPFQPPSAEDPEEPVGLAVDSGGRLFVVAATGELCVFTSRGSFLGTLEPRVSPESGSRPVAVDIAEQGSIYVLYSGPLAGVVVVDRAGREREGYGITPGAESIGSAVSLAVNETAGLMAIVVPRAEKQVRLYGLDGRLEAEFGAHGEGDGTFSLAGHAAWGPQNTIWITDTIRHSISVFDSQGTYLRRIGGFGRGPGQFCFPVACGFLSDDRLIVLERGTARCQILEVQMIPPDPLSLDSIEPHPATTHIGSLEP